MNIIEEIKQIARSTTNPYLERASKKSKVVGYFGTSVPRELLHAAGLVSYQIRAVESKGTTLGDTRLSALNCTYIRNSMDKFMQGDFDFLDGVVCANNCDHTRRIYDQLRYTEGVDFGFVHMFFVPHIVHTPQSVEMYATECIKLKAAIEERYDCTITNEALADSIALFNRQRQLLDEIDNMRADTDVRITGTEYLATMLTVGAVPVEDSITLLERLRDELLGRKPLEGHDVRVLVASGHIEELDHMELFEESGGLVVGDMLCQGCRYFDRLVEDGGDPIHSLAVRYMNKLSCPRMADDLENRINRLYEKIHDRSIDAVVVERLKFCDLWGGEMFVLGQESRRLSFPLLRLERELYGGGEGQLRTRIQAFYEMVRNTKQH